MAICHDENIEPNTTHHLAGLHPCIPSAVPAVHHHPFDGPKLAAGGPQKAKVVTDRSRRGIPTSDMFIRDGPPDGGLLIARRNARDTRTDV
jgi:hypothetical protein